VPYFHLQTTQENFKFSDYEVHRSEGDFEWLQSALEEACPERIIPPMVSHSSLHGTTYNKLSENWELCAA